MFHASNRSAVLVTGPRPGPPGEVMSKSRSAVPSRRWGPGGRELRHTLFLTLAVTVGLLTGVLVALAPPAGSAVPVWKVVSSPNPTGSTSALLSGVACPTPTNCTAVGQYYNATANGGIGFGAALVEHWNGKIWVVARSPSHDGDVLNAVTCPTPTNCMAVGSGDSSSRALVEHWNGNSWKIVSSPSPAGFSDEDLNGIACPTPTNCTAVGQYDVATANGGIATSKPLVEHWDGNSWKIVSSPSPAGFSNVFVNGVACPTPSNCTAVGFEFNDDPSGYLGKPLVERWNGKSWTFVSSPSRGLTTSGLNGVVCQTTTSCTAVGSLIEHWDGQSWAIVSSPRADLHGVACPTATNCTAVGLRPNSYYEHGNTLVEHWNSKSWTLVSSPNAPYSTLSELNGVACPTPTNCTAVGFGYTAVSEAETTLVERDV